MLSIKIIFSTVFTLFFICISQSVLAQGFHWEKVGSFYSVNFSTVNLNGTIFVYESNTFSRSTDGGSTWEEITDINTSISAITFHQNGDLYAATENNGSIYKSTNDGVNWFDTNPGNNDYSSLTISNGGNIYAGSDDGTFYTSTDEGNSWTNTIASPSQINCIAGTSNEQIFIGTSSNGIYTSTDFGGSWIHLSDINIGLNTNSITVNSIDNIFASHSEGIIVSPDLGATWELKTYSGASVNSRVIIDSIGNIYSAYNNVYRTEDSGESWANLGGSVAINSISIYQDKIYVGAERGLYRTDPSITPYYGENFLPLQAGNTWQFLCTRYTSWFGWDDWIEYKSVTEDTLIFNEKYYRYDSQWVRYSGGDNKIYFNITGTDHLFMDFNLFPVSQFMQGGPYYQQADVIQEDRNILGENYFNKGYYLYYEQVYTTTKEYFAENFGPSLYSESYNIPTGGSSKSIICAVLYDSLGNPTYYTAHVIPEFVISPITDVNSNVFSLEFNVSHSYSVFRPPGGGSGLNFIDSVKMFSYYSNGDSTTSLSPLVVTNDYENHYVVNTSLDTILLKSGFNFYYRFLAKDKCLIPEYASAPDSGYYECVWDDPVGLNAIGESFSFKLEQNYPNPFNPNTIIKYSIEEQQFVTLKVFDVLGNEIAVLVSEEKPAGNYKVDFNLNIGTHHLASGVYIYQLRAGNYIETKKMVLLK